MEPTWEFVHARGMLPGAVASAVGYRSDGLEPAVHRGLPSPYVTVVFSVDGPVTALAHPRVDAPHAQRARVVLAGLQRGPAILEQPRRQEGVQLAIHPLAARALLGVPAAELATPDFDGERILGASATALLERVADAEGWEARFALVAEALRARSKAGARPPRPELVEAWRWLRSRRGRGDLDALSRHVALGPRQLRTVFRRELGVGPKAVNRLLRFEAAVGAITDAVRRGRRAGLAGVAQSCGYFDQAHLAREFREFAGIPPSEWMRDEFRNIQAGGHRNGEDGVHGQHEERA